MTIGQQLHRDGQRRLVLPVARLRSGGVKAPEAPTMAGRRQSDYLAGNAPATH